MQRYLVNMAVRVVNTAAVSKYGCMRSKYSDSKYGGTRSKYGGTFCLHLQGVNANTVFY